MTNSLSLPEAQKAILLSQGIHNEHKLGKGKDASYKAIKALNYVQIDSISVVERAHHHSIWNRAANYQAIHIEQLLEDKQIFEYWSHAAAYLPMADYRFSLPRKNAFAKGEYHWFNVDKKDMAAVLDRIKADGPLRAKDFKDPRKTKTGWWDWKPAKKALEQLFMEGKLMAVKRQGFQKVYDLTERVLPANIDTNVPSEAEYFQHLAINYLNANAIGTAEQITYLLKGLKAPVKKYCLQMVEQGLLITLTVNDQIYFALPAIDNLLKKKISRKKVKILSPFDNLLIQRKRIKALFNYDYQIECYVPADKRKVGYFSLPLLWGNTFAGRMDVKMDRKSGVLNIINLHLETEKADEFIVDLKPILDKFLAFNSGTAINVLKVTGSNQQLPSSKVKEYTAILIA
ncbi:MAG: winged helix DNA-binding domain-containing protein [Colwellia sp.]|nr:winged helix DNA-binding domain-containing protein [Colwellia sp.]